MNGTPRKTSAERWYSWHDCNADECGNRYERRPVPALAEQWRRHLCHDRNQQADSGRRYTRKNSAEHFDVAELRIQKCEHRDDDQRRAHESGECNRRSGCSSETRTKHDREVYDVGTWKELRQREGFIEFFRRHPPALVDDHPPRP